MNKVNNQKVLEALNIKNNSYSAAKKIDLQINKINLLDLINREDRYGNYAWAVISKIILYSSSLVPQITKEYNDIDEALRLGFNWSMGPFEMLENIGLDNFFNKIGDIKTSDIRSIPIKSYKAKTPVLGIPIGRPKTASASSTDKFILIASVIATCIA